jgi:hypothetical protein
VLAEDLLIFVNYIAHAFVLTKDQLCFLQVDILYLHFKCYHMFIVYIKELLDVYNCVFTVSISVFDKSVKIVYTSRVKCVTCW